MVLTFSPLNWKLFLQETGSKPWLLLCLAASFTTFVMLILRETGWKPQFLPCFPATSPLFSHHYWRNLDALAKTYQKHRVFHRSVLILTLICGYFEVISKTSKNIRVFHRLVLILTLIWPYFEVIFGNLSIGKNYVIFHGFDLFTTELEAVSPGNGLETMAFAVSCS